MANPLAGPDHEVAGWFHAHLTRTFVSVLRAFTEFGSSEWIGVVLFFMVLYFVWKKYWPSLVTLVVAVPGGMLLRPTGTFYSARDEGAPLAETNGVQCSNADHFGRIQPHRFGRAFFDRRLGGNRVRRSLVGVLFICRQADATSRGPQPCCPPR